jgi:Glycogen recognition site of AMP-activated protein kinase
MEVRSAIHKMKMVQLYCCIICFVLVMPLYVLAQSPVKSYTIKDGKMHIEISKNLSELALDSFINKHELYDLDLKTFLKTNRADSIKKLGWEILQNDQLHFTISKPLLSFDKIKNPEEAISFTEKFITEAFLNESSSKNVQCGINRFNDKKAFAIKDSIVTFLLENNKNATKVFLAGSFNEWKPNDLAMIRTDSGWIANVVLKPGKYFYKFIVDGNWMVDEQNKLRENDNEGNTNSVFYFTNSVFNLNGFLNAKKVYVAGSFNNWEESELRMIKTDTGWELPIYLAQGTHTYRYIVDGKWLADPDNTDKFLNEFGEYNSVLRIGKPYIFSLAGFISASKVILQGSFNKWRNYELVMTKTATGWELPYTLAAGNYEYRFEVDGKTMSDPLHPNTNGNPENSILFIEPNYTFRLKGFENATSIYLAGDFNNWSPNGFAMKKEGTEWVLAMHLRPGKHLYKLIVDGKWITDPENGLWEQNEFETGNSVLWFVE